MKHEMKTPHKHAEVIKAWADGADVEVKSKESGEWCLTEYPSWAEHNEYRIKPPADVNRFVKAYLDDSGLVIKNILSHELDERYDNLRLTFDGATKKLKSAEVLK